MEEWQLPSRPEIKVHSQQWEKLNPSLQCGTQNTQEPAVLGASVISR